MEKFYNLLEWLTIEQALDYILRQTETSLTPENLMFLCNQGQCNVYLTNLVDGESILPESGLLCRASGSGALHRISSPFFHTWPQGETRRVCVNGSVTLFDFNRNGEAITTDRFGSRPAYDCDWYVDVDGKDYNSSLLFKHWDVRALADAMNGAAGAEREGTEAAALLRAEQAESQVFELRQLLEQERAAREAIEIELDVLRGQRGTESLSEIRNMLKNAAEFQAMTDRAETAERMVGMLDQQLIEQAERKRVNDQLFNDLTNELRDQHGIKKPENHKFSPTTGLIFPYVTKHLEAMRDAALEHWMDHDRSKPAPYGIQKQVQNFLAARTGENSRKVSELAAAIKPDDLPRT